MGWVLYIMGGIAPASPCIHTEGLLTSKDMCITARASMSKPERYRTLERLTRATSWGGGGHKLHSIINMKATKLVSHKTKRIILIH